VCRQYPSEGVRFKPVDEEVRDVLLEELDHRLLLPPQQIQPSPGAFDGVLAAPNSNKLKGLINKEIAETNQTKPNPECSNRREEKEFASSRITLEFVSDQKQSRAIRNPNNETTEERGAQQSKQ
jgi:hypothetical protein